ncbi:MAG TPA: adenosylcobinamide-phosphate synthase CbiB [Feifaniaceae bacterium]|nr:adenosylcobinamide-phosphate synthase CbiB [Feifaniaceae bacterium]
MLVALSTLALCAGFILDLLLGDPQGWPHIVRGIGGLIAALEKAFYPMENKRLGGALLVLLVLLICTALPAALLYAAWRLSPWAYFSLETLLCWQLIALKSLRAESRKVYEALIKNDLPAARKAVSMIVGRDTAALDEAGVTRAAVETVAENASDGVIAPLLCLALGGAAFGMFYKAVNTMDSMIGYKNERYMEFGRFAAKLDDVMNFLPSRLSALLMIAMARPCGLDAKSARRIWKRDRRKHASPNSAQTEAVMAGALNVRLAGNACYFGKLHEKPYIGDDLKPIGPRDILLSHRLLYAASVLMFFLALAVRGCLYAAL